jgi:hypothetical protein
MAESNTNETKANEPAIIALTPQEREPVDDISAQIKELSAQRTGMILMLARLKGAQNASIDYRDGQLIVTPRQ